MTELLQFVVHDARRGLVFRGASLTRKKQLVLAAQHSEWSSEFVRCVRDELPELAHDGVNFREKLVRVVTKDRASKQKDDGEKNCRKAPQRLKPGLNSSRGSGHDKPLHLSSCLKRRQ